MSASLIGRLAAARPLQPHERDQFLRDVAEQLARYQEVGPGIVSRVKRII